MSWALSAIAVADWGAGRWAAAGARVELGQGRRSRNGRQQGKAGVCPHAVCAAEPEQSEGRAKDGRLKGCDAGRGSRQGRGEDLGPFTPDVPCSARWQRCAKGGRHAQKPAAL